MECRHHCTYFKFLLEECGMSDIKLKPCPFCGKSVTVFTNAKEMKDCSYYDDCYSLSCPMIAIVCDVNDGGCGASTGYGWSKDVVIEKWNRRSKE